MSAGAAALELAIVALGVARLTVLVTSDRILQGPRDRWQRRFGAYSYPGYLSWCPWCAGFWIALVATGAWLLWPATALWLLPWAVAFVASALAARFGEADAPPPDVPPGGPSDTPREDA